MQLAAAQKSVDALLHGFASACSPRVHVFQHTDAATCTQATLKKHGNELQEFFNPAQPQDQAKAPGRLNRRGKLVVPEMLATERGERFSSTYRTVAARARPCYACMLCHCCDERDLRCMVSCTLHDDAHSMARMQGPPAFIRRARTSAGASPPMRALFEMQVGAESSLNGASACTPLAGAS